MAPSAQWQWPPGAATSMPGLRRKKPQCMRRSQLTMWPRGARTGHGPDVIVLGPRDRGIDLEHLQTRALLPARLRGPGRTARRDRTVHTPLQPRPAVLQDREHQPDHLRAIVGQPSGSRRINRVSTFRGEPHCPASRLGTRDQLRSGRAACDRTRHRLLLATRGSGRGNLKPYSCA